jgi:hypothetical protein
VPAPIFIEEPVPTPTPTQTPTTEPTATPTPTQEPTSTSSPAPTQSPQPSVTTTPNQPSRNEPEIQTPTPTQQPTPKPESVSTPNPTTTPEPKNEAPNNLEENAQPPALKTWFRHPGEDEIWASGSKKTITWGTSYGASSLIAKLELSKSGISGPWTTLVENLTNSNYYDWNVPNLESGDNYYISVTVTDTSTPQKTASDIIAVKIAQPPTDNQLMAGFPILLVLAILAFVLVRKKLVNIRDNGALRISLGKFAKYPALHITLKMSERAISAFYRVSKGEKN